jgi:enoyl-CoA hydratase/carnithine racemase
LAYDADSERAHAALRASFLPSIAMIRGFCMGGGLALALSCDLRFAATDAKFAIPAAKLGLAYPHQSLRQLVSLCGPSVAKDLLFSARRFGSEEALAMGLIDRVCEPGDLADQVNTYAAMVAENAPLTLRCAKAGIDEAAGNGRGADLDALLRACYESADYAEGRAAFAEKRKSVFRGK